MGRETQCLTDSEEGPFLIVIGLLQLLIFSIKLNLLISQIYDILYIYIIIKIFLFLKQIIVISDFIYFSSSIMGILNL